METVIVDKPAQHVARVMINRPDARNAMNAETRAALIVAIRGVLAERNNRALLLCGAQGMFCAGGDLPTMRGLSEEDAAARMQQGRALVMLLWNADIPVVAAVEKYAVGAGAGLALLSDYVVCGESALFSFPFLQLGLAPDWGSTQMLIRRAGWGRARQLILDKASPRGEELLRLGIVDQLVADNQVLDTATAKAVELSRHPQTAFRLFKRQMQAFPIDFDAALVTETRDQTTCLLSAEFDEGLSAALEKREADFVSLSQ